MFVLQAHEIACVHTKINKQIKYIKLGENIGKTIQHYKYKLPWIFLEWALTNEPSSLTSMR